MQNKDADFLLLSLFGAMFLLNVFTRLLIHTHKHILLS